MADVHVDGTVERGSLTVIEILHQGIAREHAAGGTHEHLENVEFEGGPFSAVAYCWEQALQYFPPDKRKDMERWFFEEQFQQLLKWDDEYPKNLVRKQNDVTAKNMATTLERIEEILTKQA